MKNKLIKKITAAAMAFALIGGAVSVPTGDKSIFGSLFTANAADSFASLNPENGILTIGGEINKNMLEPYKSAKAIIADESAVLPEDCSSLFENFSAREIDLSKADTSNVKNMYSMFQFCYYLTSVNLSNFNTKNVTNMAYLFYGCAHLESVDLSSFDTSNVENMRNMFEKCESLKELDLSNFNTKKVTDMYQMFYGCLSLNSLDLISFDTSSVKDMEGMFKNCNGLTEIDISSFDTGNVENMDLMFSYCSKLSSIDLSNFNTSNVITMKSMFSFCQALTNVNVSSFDTSNVKYMHWMFEGCSSLSTLDVSNFTVGKDTDASYMFPWNLEPSICKVKGNSVTLDGNIGVNVYLQPCEKLAKVVMSGPNGDRVYTDFTGITQDNGYFKFSYPINATQGNEQITLKAYDKDGRRLIVCDNNGGLCNHSQVECTVYDYIDQIKKHEMYSAPTLAALVDGLENYCKAAENYFNGTSNTIAVIENVTADSVSDYATDLGSDVKLSLVLNSAAALRIYTESDDVLIDDETVKPRYKGGNKYYEIPNICAQQLSTAHKITIGGTDYSCSALSYVHRVLNNSNARDNKLLTDMAKATYVYAQAAVAYVTQ